MTILRRVLAWTRRCGGDVLAGLGRLTDTRERPRIALEHAIEPLFVMALARMGSLNALEQSAASRIWRQFADGRLPSADTLGRLAARIDLDEVRQVVFAHYERLKRNKALAPPWHGLIALVLDGHESTASYRRCCPGCLARTVHTAQGEREQHYHRYVAASLVGEDVHVFLDVEEQLPGENELPAALRLLRRVRARYPRAYDVVIADAFYAQAPFFRAVLAQGKDALVVLKQQERDLYEDALALCESVPPVTFERGRTRVRAWDLGDLRSWPALGRPVRVVRTLETTRVRRQKTEQAEDLHAEWMWVTTLSPTRATTRAVVALGHSRWDIENRGFNEGANDAHLDHVYRHEPNAMRVLTLLTMLAMNVLHAFHRLNLKPAFRARHSLRHVAALLAAAIYTAIPPVSSG